MQTIPILWTMQNDFIKTGKGKIRLHRFGIGSRLLIALHGYADSGQSFSVFEKHLGEDFTLIAPDLPFHGKTNWHSHNYGKLDIIEMINYILERESGASFDLLGHSLGGEIALSIAPHFTNTLNRLLLLAPGGLGVKGMSIPDAIPVKGRRWIAKLLEQPGFLLKLADWLVNLKLLDQYSRKFLEFHLNDPTRRNRLMQTWISKGNFRIDKNEIKYALKEGHFSLLILLGDTDPLISKECIKKWLGESPGVILRQVRGGHKLITRNTASSLRQWLKV